MRISRRHAVMGGLFGTMVSASSLARAQALLAPTGQETFGPFIRSAARAVMSSTSTHFPGKTGKALGQVIELSGRGDRPDRQAACGRVISPFGRPMPQAATPIRSIPIPRRSTPISSVWSPSGRGRTGPTRSARSSLDLIRTLRHDPHAAYPFRCDARGLSAGDTDMGFPGEPLNETDILLSTLAARRRNPANAICKPAPSDKTDTLAFTWDIVLLA